MVETARLDDGLLARLERLAAGHVVAAQGDRALEERDDGGAVGGFDGELLGALAEHVHAHVRRVVNHRAAGDEFAGADADRAAGEDVSGLGHGGLGLEVGAIGGEGLLQEALHVHLGVRG